jgi:hypothetical protein
MRVPNDEQHEKLWHLCNRIVVEAAGARAAMLCDARDGNVLISVGETNQSGQPTGMTKLGPKERVVQGAAGNVYGVDLPNDFLLAVLHDEGALEGVRAAVSRATPELAEILLPPPPPPPQKRKARAPRAKPKAKARKRR